MKIKHETILKAAMDLATIKGLDGLTIGGLATHIGLSKSGLFSHFGSKEKLQVDVVKAARKVFILEVIVPVNSMPSGIRRLYEFSKSWIGYSNRKISDGGCFFSTTSLEFNTKPGAVRDEVSRSMALWLNVLKRQVQVAIRKKELSDNADPDQLAFIINSLCMGANWSIQMFNDDQAADRALKSIIMVLKKDENINWVNPLS